VKTDRFHFDLPESAIAQLPSDRRDDSRLLVVDRHTGQVSDYQFKDLPDILPKNLDLVRNNARVMKARLPALRESGSPAECFLLRPAKETNNWWCLLRPGKKIPCGASIHWPGFYTATVLEKSADGPTLLNFATTHQRPVEQLADTIGKLPLPPYIQRAENDARQPIDEERYQTVYAQKDRQVAIAAPTAGLHFTHAMIDCLRNGGHQFHDLTLHVGLGTFRPIQVDDLSQHPMHEEYYEVPAATLQRLRTPGDRKTLAVGTTSMRTIEDIHRKGYLNAANQHQGDLFGSADLFIYPPASFYTDCLLTNFHLPRSTLICLVSAFLTPDSTDGIDWCLQIYKSALDLGYRFYSYGDAMLIL
jgi:S-adenosylmethionine:tRNA ribosyltransferase-isomerase